MAKKSKAAAAASELYAQKLAKEAQCKAIYGDIDQIEAELIAAIQAANGTIELPDGRRLMLEDNFLDREGRPRNKAFKTCAIARFAIVAK